MKDVMDHLLEFSRSGAQSAAAALEALALPFLVFLALGLAVKRGALLSDMRRAFPQSLLKLQILVFNVVFVVPVIVLLSQWLHDLAAVWHLLLIGPASWVGWPPLAVVAVAILAGDFAGYWRHRFEHTPLLWPAHAVHHSDDEMTWLTLERFHPVNRITTFVLDNPALLLLGLPAYAIIANNLVRHYYGYLIHADLP